MKYFLIKETTYFVDPHGTSDLGGTKKFVTTDEDYANLNGKNCRYGEELDYEPSGSEDGYNSQYEYMEVREISEEDYLRYQLVIELYDSL